MIPYTICFARDYVSKRFPPSTLICWIDLPSFTKATRNALSSFDLDSELQNDWISRAWSVSFVLSNATKSCSNFYGWTYENSKRYLQQNCWHTNIMTKSAGDVHFLPLKTTIALYNLFDPLATRNDLRQKVVFDDYAISFSCFVVRCYPQRRRLPLIHSSWIGVCNI